MLQNALYSVHLLISGTQERMPGLVEQLAWYLKINSSYESLKG